MTRIEILLQWRTGNLLTEIHSLIPEFDSEKSFHLCYDDSGLLKKDCIFGR